MNGSVSLFYWKKWSALSILPSAGLYLEQMQPDYEYDVKKTATGGIFNSLTCGLDVYIKQFSMGVRYISQFAYDIPAAQPRPSDRIGAHMIVMF